MSKVIGVKWLCMISQNIILFYTQMHSSQCYKFCAFYSSGQFKIQQGVPESGNSH